MFRENFRNPIVAPIFTYFCYSLICLTSRLQRRDACGLVTADEASPADNAFDEELANGGGDLDFLALRGNQTLVARVRTATASLAAAKAAKAAAAAAAAAQAAAQEQNGASDAAASASAGGSASGKVPEAASHILLTIVARVIIEKARVQVRARESAYRLGISRIRWLSRRCLSFIL